MSYKLGKRADDITGHGNSINRGIDIYTDLLVILVSTMTPTANNKAHWHSTDI